MLFFVFFYYVLMKKKDDNDRCVLELPWKNALKTYYIFNKINPALVSIREHQLYLTDPKCLKTSELLCLQYSQSWGLREGRG